MRYGLIGDILRLMMKCHILSLQLFQGPTWARWHIHFLPTKRTAKIIRKIADIWAILWTYVHWPNLIWTDVFYRSSSIFWPISIEICLYNQKTIVFDCAWEILLMILIYQFWFWAGFGGKCAQGSGTSKPNQNVSHLVDLLGQLLSRKCDSDFLILYFGQ